MTKEPLSTISEPEKSQDIRTICAKVPKRTELGIFEVLSEEEDGSGDIK